MSKLRIKKDVLKTKSFFTVTDTGSKRITKVIVPSELQVGLNQAGFKLGASVYGGIVLKSGEAPKSTDSRLYNENGILKFDGAKIKATGGGDIYATYVVMSATGSLDAERVLTAGTGISSVDGGAGSTVTLALAASELSALGTTAEVTDYVVIEDVTDNSTKKVLVSNLPDTAGWTDDGTVVRLSTSTDYVGIGTTAPKTSLVDIQDYNTVVWTTQLADGEGGGHIIKLGAGTTTAGQLYHFTASAGGTWSNSDASGPGSGAYNLLGVALGTSPTSDGMLLRGYTRVASTLVDGTAVAGAPVYVSPTANKFTFSRPGSAGEFVRVIGYCLALSGGDILLYFNPDPTWVEIS